MGVPRIGLVAPGSRAELATLEADILRERGRISPLYQVLLNSPPMAQGWEQLLSAVRNRNSLPPALREMVILRVAVLNRAPYEFDTHVPHALAAGLSASKIEALRLAEPSGLFDPCECVVLGLTDAMTRDIEVPDVLFEQVRQHFEGQRLLDLCVTVAAYNMVSRLLAALHIGHTPPA